MKKLLLITLLLLINLVLKAQDYTLIPDEKFEQYLINKGLDSDKTINGKVLTSDINEEKTLVFEDDDNITDITGLEDFIALDYLKIYDTYLIQKHLDLSKNTLLEKLIIGSDINSNNITSIDLSKNLNLKFLTIEESKIQTLDLWHNINLTNFICRKNEELINLNIKNNNNNKIVKFESFFNPKLICIKVNDAEFSENSSKWIKDAASTYSEVCNEGTYIPDPNFQIYLESMGFGNGVTLDNYVDTDKIAALETLDISFQEITNLTGIEEFVSLVNLDANRNAIVSVDFSKNINLETLKISSNSIRTFDLSKNLKLKTLDVARNQLSELDVSLNLDLKELNVGINQLTYLDVSKLTNLERLDCFSNRFAAMNITKNEKLYYLDCSDNQIEHINIYSNILLKRFKAHSNKIKYIDIQNNINLIELDFSYNELVALNLKNGKNQNLFTFNITNNPTLTCVEVDNANFSTNNWLKKDNQTAFSKFCPPVNDMCSNAIPLSFGQLTPGDVNSANSNNNAPCADGTVLADVWFSIIVPETREFSLEGVAFGGRIKFAVYETCNSQVPIDCGENISLEDLTANVKLYIKVWLETSSSNKRKGKQSETGTFTITAKESSVLSTDDFLKDTPQLILYPNPTNSLINIKTTNNIFFDAVEVYNLLGKRMIFNKINSKSKINIDVSNLASGIYFIKVKTADKILSKKFIIN